MSTLAVRVAAQGVGGAGAPGNLAAFSSNPVTGDAIVVIQTFHNASAHSAPTDTQANTYVQIGTTFAALFDANVTISMWMCGACTGGANTVTLHATSAVTAWVGVGTVFQGPAVASGPHPNLPWNGEYLEGRDINLTDVHTATGGTHVASGSLALAGMSSDGLGGAVSNGPGWTSSANQNQTSTTFQDLYVEWLPVSSSYQGQWTANPDVVSVTSLTGSASPTPFTATATTAAPHGFFSGETILISGASPGQYNGYYSITVTGLSTFTYVFPGPPDATSGTITASRNGSHVQIAASFAPAIDNTGSDSATDLGTTLPVTVTANVVTQGTAQTVWYSYTAQPGDIELGVWAFGDLTTYKPTITTYLGPSSALQPWPIANGPISAQNVPIQMPVTVGSQYFFRIAPNGNPSPANLTLNVQRGPNNATVPVGTLVMSDDTAGFPMVLLSPTTGVLKFILDFPAGEAGDVLATSGKSLMYDQASTNFKLYNADLTLNTTVDGSWLVGGDPAGALRVCQGTQTFFVGSKGSGLTHATVREVTPAGAFGTTFGPFAAAGLTAIAANNDESLLYYAGNGGSVGSAIKTWNLGTNMAAADLVAGVAGSVVTDIMVLADNSIAALYFHPTATKSVTLLQYTSGGATTHSYTLASGAGVGATSPRMGYAIDDPNSVWVFLHTTSGTSTFANIKMSDGSTIQSLTTNDFEDGGYQATANVSPARFGTSFSCPLWVTRVAVTQGTNVTFTTIPRVIRRLRRAPHIAQLGQRIYINRFLLDMQTGVGANDVPTTPGHDPTVMLRWSKNGGQTFSDEIEMSAGELGHYFKRVYVWRLGQARDWVFEVTVSDPVSWSLMAAVLDLEPGTN